MTAPDTATRITDALQRGVANLKQRGANVNEATTRSVLVDSVLDALGYPPPNRSPEESTFDNRPDYLCYVGAVSPQSGYPSLSSKPRDWMRTSIAFQVGKHALLLRIARFNVIFAAIT